MIITVLGWLGAAALLLAYGLVSAGRLAAGGAVFQLLNLAGGIALAINSAYHGAWPSAALNIVWIGIGVASLAARRRRPADPPPPAGTAQRAVTRRSRTRSWPCHRP